MCTMLEVVGDQKDMNGICITEELELWDQNPVEYIQELLENPAFDKENAYTLYHIS